MTDILYAAVCRSISLSTHTFYHNSKYLWWIFMIFLSTGWFINGCSLIFVIVSWFFQYKTINMGKRGDGCSIVAIYQFFYNLQVSLIDMANIWPGTDLYMITVYFLQANEKNYTHHYNVILVIFIVSWRIKKTFLKAYKIESTYTEKTNVY